MGIHYEEGIVLDFLSRLPVRSLLRFKCVSKFWETLISESYFKMKQLNHAQNDFNSQKLLVGQQVPFNGGMFSFHSSSLSTNQLVQDVQNLGCPSNCTPFGIASIFSSCDGLVLLGIVSLFRKQLLLWNPSTRESTKLVLPHSGFTLQDNTFGLGYDATSEGYKILKLSKWCVLPSVEILTLKSGSWRSICNNPTILCPKTGYQMEIRPYLSQDFVIDPVVFVHGAFHWLGRSNSNHHSVVSFSTSNEVYGDIPLLDQMYRVYNMQSSNYGISVLEGTLCFYSTHNHQGCSTFKLWVMKDYGVVESWTELFTLRVSDISLAKPKYRYADGEILLQCSGGHSGDVFRTSKGPFGLWPEYLRQEGIVYTESLISPKLLI